MIEIFRLTKAVQYLGMAGTVLFLAALGCSVSTGFLKNPAEHGFKGEHSVALAVGMGVVVFGSMLLASLYIWASYYIERFTIEGTTFSIRTLLQRRRFEASELRSVKWKVNRGGGISFRTGSAKARLDLVGYAEADRLRIIRAVHGSVPSELQEGWPMFCHKVALPLRDGKQTAAHTVPPRGLCRITRRRYDRALLIALPLSIAVACALSIWLESWKFVVFPILVIGFWVLLRFQAPSEGLDDVRLTWSFKGRPPWIGLAAILTSLLVMLGLGLLGLRGPLVVAIACIPAMLGCGPTLYWAWRLDKERRAADDQAAPVAPAQWQQGEDAALANAGSAEGGQYTLFSE